MATDTSDKIVEDFKGKKGNEFSTTVALTHDFERNTYHLKLDKKNRSVSMKTPEGQGMEMRDAEAPCESFTEATGPEERGFFMSRTFDLAVWRDKLNKMYIGLDDRQQLILIRNELDKIQIFADGNVEVISKKDINMRAAKNINMKAGGSICMEAAGGTKWTVRAGHVGTNDQLRAGRITCITMKGLHEDIDIPQHPAGPAPVGVNTDCDVAVPIEEKIEPRKPKPFNQGYNCAPNKPEATPIPPETFSGGGGGFGGGGGGGGGGSPGEPPPRSPGSNVDTPPDIIVNPTPTPEDPLEPSGGALFYGLSTVFKDEVTEFGLRLDSFANNENIPPNTDATKIILFFNTFLAADAAEESKKLHGGRALILRVTGVPDASLVTYKTDELIAEYEGDIPIEGIEFFDEEPEP
jgi:hypothetical protein